MTLDRTVTLVGGGMTAAAIALVALSLRREPPTVFPVTPPVPAEVPTGLAEPRILTIDATDPDRWVFLDLARGALVDGANGRDWDLAFRRFEVMVNGGPGFHGHGAAVDLGPVAFDSVTVAPVEGWVQTNPGRDSTHPALSRWYRYGFTSHLLTPLPRVWAIRTADGFYGKLRFLSYYCPGPTPGCITLEYVYQGDGSRRLVR